MPKTRSKGGASSEAAGGSATATPSKSRYALAPETTNPPRLFIMPKKASGDARIVSLSHPRYRKATRYLACPETGFYEFTKVAAPKSTPRSWLIEHETGETEGKTAEDEADMNACVTKGADLFIATPIDPIFLVLPALSTETSAAKSSKRMFLSSDDHFDAISESSPHISELLRSDKMRKLLEARMSAVCDTVEAGDETMFRLSEDKLLAEILGKARRMSNKPLPKSMEEKFVTKSLEAPLVSLKRETASSAAAEQASTPAMNSEVSTPRLDQSESQSTSSSTDTAPSLLSEASIASTAATIESEEATIEEVGSSIQASAETVKLQRLRTAFNFICSSYIALEQTVQLKRLLSEARSQVDFTPLDEYLAELTKLRQEAASARSMGDYSRKRMLDDDEIAEREEKRRRKEEEEKKKKAGLSRGVKDLKKVNTSGMKKMSDFFKKK